MDEKREVVDAIARKLYETSCALDPLDEERQPDRGRGGYKTEVMYWHGLARAALSVMPPDDVREATEKALVGAKTCIESTLRLLNDGPVNDVKLGCIGVSSRLVLDELAAALRTLDDGKEGE